MPDPLEVTPDVLRGWPLPEPGSDKEQRGRLLVAGGSRATPGAVLLAGEAALRAGGGKLRIGTARSVAAQLAVALPEARVAGLPENNDGSVVPDAADALLGLADGCATVLIGPGLVDPDTALALLEAVVPRLDATVVLDALGTAYVTEEPDRLAELPATFVITVNPGELAQVQGRDATEVGGDPLADVQRLAARTRAVVLCGGQGKLVSDGHRSWRIGVGGNGLAVSGSGDVQAGIVAGLLARGAEPAQAAVWGGYLHGRAGDRLADRIGPVGFLARELPGELPALLDDLAPA